MISEVCNAKEAIQRLVQARGGEAGRPAGDGEAIGGQEKLLPDAQTASASTAGNTPLGIKPVRACLIASNGSTIHGVGVRHSAW